MRRVTWTTLGWSFAGGKVAGLQPQLLEVDRVARRLGGPWAGPAGAVADEEVRVEDLEQEGGQGQVKILGGEMPAVTESVTAARPAGS